MLTKLKNIFKRKKPAKRTRLAVYIDISLIAIVFILVILVLKLYSFSPSLLLQPLLPHRPPKEVIDLNNPPLSLSYEVESTQIRWQEGIKLVLHVKNNSSYELKDIKFNLLCDCPSFSLSQISFANQQKTSLSGFNINGYNLYLDKLGPGADREVALDLDLLKHDSSSLTISGLISSEYRVADQTLKAEIKLPTLKVASELKAQARVYYHSPQGDQLGSGAFPPIIGLPTKFWVYFQLQPETKYRDFVMSTRLSPNVDYTGKLSLQTGNVSYNEENKQLVWQIKDIADLSADYMLGFEIELTPSSEQVARFAPLLSNIRYQATELETGLVIANNITDLDTSLKADLINKDEGRVRSLEEL